MIADLVTKLGLDDSGFKEKVKSNARYAKESADKMRKSFAGISDGFKKNKGLLFFRRNINQATKSMKKLGRAAQRTIALTSRFIRDFGTLSRFFLMGAGVGGFGLFGAFKLVDNLSNQAKEIRNWSDALGISTQKLQEFQIAGESVNLSSTKMSDILKDVNDKLGDFALTGGGEAGDVLKHLGINFDLLRNKSPDEALKTLVNSIQSLSNQQQTFVLEALANDASKLLPLLRNNSEAFNELVANAKASGRLLSEEDLADLKKYQQIVKQLTNLWQGLKLQIGKNLAAPFGRLIEKITEMLKKVDLLKLAKTISDKILSALQIFTSAMISFAEVATQLLSGLSDTVNALKGIKTNPEKSIGNAVASFAKFLTIDAMKEIGEGLAQTIHGKIPELSGKGGKVLSQNESTVQKTLNFFNILKTNINEAFTPVLKSSLPAIHDQLFNFKDVVKGSTNAIRNQQEKLEAFNKNLSLSVKELKLFSESDFGRITKDLLGSAEDKLTKKEDKLRDKFFDKELGNLLLEAKQSMKRRETGDLNKRSSQIVEEGILNRLSMFKFAATRDLSSDQLKIYKNVFKDIEQFAKGVSPEIEQKFKIELEIGTEDGFWAKVKKTVQNASNDPKVQAELMVLINQAHSKKLEETAQTGG